MKRNAEYFEAHPEEVPDDLESLEALARGEEIEVPDDTGTPGNADAAKNDEGGKGDKGGGKTKGEDGATGDSDGEAPAAEGEKKEGNGIDGVMAKDGKHIIPYSVLESARDRAARAEQLVADQAARIAAMEEKLKAGEAESGDKGQIDIPAEDLELIEEEFPEFAKIIRAQAAQIDRLNKMVEAAVTDKTSDEADSVRSVVQEAIDAIPKLAYLQAADPEGFARAQQIDEILKSDPANKDLSLKDRFEKVVKMLEAARGEIKVPGSGEPAGKTGKAVEDALSKADDRQTPSSLSEIPGGERPPGSELERVEKMSPVELGLMFEKMTPEQQEEYLARL